jgi:hypothetical protein
MVVEKASGGDSPLRQGALEVSVTPPDYDGDCL